MPIFTLPRIVYWGEDALEQFIAYMKQGGIKRIFVITDRNIANLGLLDILLKELDEFVVETFDAIEPEPSLDTVIKAGIETSKFSPEIIVALGGGSVIDAAKGAWIKYENPDFDLETISPFREIGLGKKAILASIPTTSGTGSEVTLGVVYTVTKGGRKEKIALGSFEVISNIVILDTRFVVGLPENLTLYTGLDALSHAVEALVSTTSNDFSEALSIRCILNIFELLPEVLSDMNNIELRKRMQLTAMMAGMAFSNSGLGLAHGIAHSLGATFHIHHGKVVSIVLPYIVKINYEDERAMTKYEYMSRLLTYERLSKGDPFYTQLHKFIKSLGGETSLKDIIAEEEFFSKIDDIVELAIQDPDLIYNPVVPDEDLIKKVLKDIYQGHI
jgi:alcohol dehydrogenase class IV